MNREKLDLHQTIKDLITYFETTDLEYSFKGYWILFLNKLDKMVRPRRGSAHNEVVEWVELQAFCEMMAAITFEGRCETDDEDLMALNHLSEYIRDQSGTFFRKK